MDTGLTDISPYPSNPHATEYHLRETRDSGLAVIHLPSIRPLLCVAYRLANMIQYDHWNIDLMEQVPEADASDLADGGRSARHRQPAGRLGASGDSGGGGGGGSGGA